MMWVGAVAVAETVASVVAGAVLGPAGVAGTAAGAAAAAGGGAGAASVAASAVVPSLINLCTSESVPKLLLANNCNSAQIPQSCTKSLSCLLSVYRMRMWR